MGAGVEELRRLVGEEKVRTATHTLLAYSTDASIYRVKPQAVIGVREEEDVLKAVTFAKEWKIPITPRGAGTGMSGSSLGEGIILDFSAFDQIIEINRKEKWVRVRPGVLLGDLNRELSRIGMMFPPDPASADFCRIGGMIGHNASGPRTVKYGATKDYVIELVLVLPNGRRIRAKRYKVDTKEFEHLRELNPSIDHLFQVVLNNRSFIKNKKPKVEKNSSGYNLFDLATDLEKGEFDLPKIFVGSEGTLGIVTEVKLAVVDEPKGDEVAVVYFEHLDDAAQTVPSILALDPMALEIMEWNSLDLIGRKRFGIPDSAEAMLFVEFDGDPGKNLKELSKICKSYKLSGPIRLAETEEEKDELWEARRAIVPTLYRYSKKMKPIPFIEDTVVPTDKVPEFIHYCNDLFEERSIQAGIYGHIGDGNTHIRPLLSVKNPEDLSQMEDLAERVYSKVMELGGSISGEHGDGRLRSDFLQRQYGERMYHLFRMVKEAFDPLCIMNPGVKITERHWREGVDIKKMSIDCATCGTCNPHCPIFDTFRMEETSPRGWLNLYCSDEQVSKEIDHLTELCLNCKSCREVCPAGLDPSSEILKRRVVNPPRAWRPIFFVQSHPFLAEIFGSVFSYLQPFWDSSIGRRILEKFSKVFLARWSPVAQISSTLKLPRFAVAPLKKRLGLRSRGRSSKVCYFHGCADNLLDMGIGEDLVYVLEKEGIRVAIPPQRCCGAPMVTYGFKERRIANAKYNIDSLIKYETVITSCASCNLSLKDYARLFEDDEYVQKARELASKVVDISEYLVNYCNLSFSSKSAKKTLRVTYHDPCHLRVSGIRREPRILIKSLPGIDFVEMPDSDRCCGAAGTFSIKNPEVSGKVFERKRRAVELVNPDIVATSCPSCILQFSQKLDGKQEVLHVVQLVHRALTG